MDETGLVRTGEREGFRTGPPGTFPAPGEVSRRPFAFLAILAIAVFAAEAAVMVLLPHLPTLSRMRTAMLDASILTGTILPLLYFFLYRPLSAEMRAKNRALTKFQESNRLLERTVEDRTVHLVREVAKRKATEESLQHQIEFSESLVRGSAVATFVLNLDHEVVAWNPACEKLTGVPAGSVLGTTDHWNAFSRDRQPCLADLVIDGEGLEEARSLHETAGMSSLRPDGLTAEAWCENLGGERRYLAFDAAPICDRSGRRVAAVETVRDLTDVKRSEEAALRSVSLLSSTLESTGEGVLVVDTARHILLRNRRFAEMWQLPEDLLAEATGRRIVAYCKDQLRDPETFVQVIEELHAQPTAHRRDILEFHDGRVFERRSQPYLLAGRPAGRVWSFRDITKEHQLEEQFRQAQKMDALGTLAGGIAHDFNNILTAILGYAELLADDLPGEGPVRGRLQQICAASERARDMVRRLLAFSRPAPFRNEVVRLTEVVEEALELIRVALPGSIELRFRVDTTADRVRGDSSQLHQVVVNLCTNAMHAMGDRDGRLEVALAAAELPAELRPLHPGSSGVPQVRLTVSDTGCGMTREVLARVFEPFFTTKAPGEGTGLGLSAVHGIVQSHGGAVSVDSRPGEGTAFHVYLPTTGEHRQSMESAPEPAPRGTGRILLADDEEAVRNVGKAMLEALGYEVTSCGSGSEALEVLQKDPGRFDLLVTDHSMPKMTGEQLVREARAIRPDLPALICSGYDCALGAAAEEGKGVEVLHKPFRRLELASAVARARGDEGRDRPAARQGRETGPAANPSN